jgi:hypothetical protein
LIAKNRVFIPGVAFGHLSAHRIGGQSKLACIKFVVAPGDII